MSRHEPSPFSPRNAVDTNELDANELGLTAPQPIAIDQGPELPALALDEHSVLAGPNSDHEGRIPARSWLGDVGSSDRRPFAVEAFPILKTVGAVVSGLVTLGLLWSVIDDLDDAGPDSPPVTVSAGATSDSIDDGAESGLSVGGASAGARSRFGQAEGRSSSSVFDDQLAVNSDAADGDSTRSRSTSGRARTSRRSSGSSGSSSGPTPTVATTALSTTTSLSTSTSDAGSSTSGDTSTSIDTSTSLNTTTPSSSSTTDSSSGSTSPTEQSPTTTSSTGSTTSASTTETTTGSSPTAEPSTTTTESETGSGS